MGKLAPHSELLVAKLTPGHPIFDIIEDAYRVFTYPKPKSTEVCQGCCMAPSIEADFFNPPIGELPLGYIRDWYCAAYDPNGVAKGTWAYLLPRILEILAAGEDVSSVGIEVSLGRFDTGNSDNWSSEEWYVLDRFQRALLRYKFAPGSGYLDDVICMFRLAGWPLEQLLEQIRSFSDAELAQRLWHDWSCEHLLGGGSIWITAFWESTDKTAIYDFYTSSELYTRMEVLALSDDTEAELARRASAVASVIEACTNYPLTA